MSSVVDGWINAYLRRLRMGEFLQWAADVCAVFCIAFGVCVLSVKLFIPGLWPGVLFLAIGLLPAAAFAWRLAGNHRWTRADAVMRLDQALQAQGLLMMLEEVAWTDSASGAWTKCLADYESKCKQVMPRFRPRRFVGYLFLPLLFAIAVCFVPLRTAADIALQQNSLSRTTTRELAELVELMQKQNLIDDPKEELQVKNEIQKLAEDTRYKPLTHEQWEAVDALQERLSMRINAANSMLSKAANGVAELKAANEAAEMFEKGDDSLAAEESQKQLDDAYDAFERTMGAAGLPALKNGKKLAQNSSKSGDAKLRKRLSKEEADELADLKDFLNEEQKKLNELKSQCKCKCKGNGQCEGGECVDGDGVPGEGGVTRGRADAELTWGKEPDENGFKFKEVVLPERDVDEPGEVVVKIERAAPVVDPAASAPRSVARNIDAAAGVSTWNRKLSPRHRNIVQKYFDGR